MSASKSTPSSDELAQIIASAQRLGVEMDEEEAIQWLTAIAAAKSSESELVIDTSSGVFGHRVTMLDFSPEDLTHFREIGRLVEFMDQPGRVETALALSGSAAQSKIQSYPGDADYFERVNIIAETQAEACQILADLIRTKALNTAKGPSYQLIEVKFGSYPYDVIHDSHPIPAGSPISWSVEEIQAGKIDTFKTDGSPAVIRWEEAAADPGWCKLDWVIADPLRGQLANASNMLDVTWEAPDGSITPLDGFMDPYFQEVYLEAESIPIFSKLSKHVSADALESYISQLEKEVNKYLTKEINYGKAAKRMYNIFRLTGRYEEAAFLRELFDEPTTLLYQVWSLIRTIDDASNPDSPITVEHMLAQTDQLIIAVIETLEGEQETEIVRRLLRLRDSFSHQQTNNKLSSEAEAARAEVINVVNNFFYEKLTAVPTIKVYIEEKQYKS
ncbi:MAG: hypothetical protein JSV61_16705 [Anaerolineales bacterium]|nr:MAG: hypothetical protein JSV61_16705 [Anaerolineales bacterium]